MSIPERIRLTLPENHQKVLLHTCCAPCSGEIIETLILSEIEFAMFFYNPNIHPKEEYLIRKDENKEFALKKGIPFIDADYDTEEWMKRAKGMEQEPERGIRCSMCFDLRLERSALYAYENGYTLFTSSLGISRCKDLNQVNQSGKQAAEKYEGLEFWDYNWRKKGGSARGAELCRCEGFYRQAYCGCIYSLRDTNRWRISQGREPIKIKKRVEVHPEVFRNHQD